MRRVLVVDDVAVNAKLVSALLRANAFAVDVAFTGEEALARIAAGSFDLVLLDLRLPGIDGIAVARALRADPAHAHLAIVAVTANAMKSDEQAALAAGCDAFVSKPINTRTFVPLVAELIARKGGA